MEVGTIKTFSLITAKRYSYYYRYRKVPRMNLGVTKSNPGVNQNIFLQKILEACLKCPEHIHGTMVGVRVTIIYFPFMIYVQIQLTLTDKKSQTKSNIAIILKLI